MTDIPVIINNFNRLTTLQKLIAWLREANQTRIIVLDNASTYPPLLSYYRQAEREGVKVIRLKQNSGPRALWKQPDKSLLQSPFIYTDSDVLPAEECPMDLIDFLWRAGQEIKGMYQSSWGHNRPLQKIGPALNISNIPDCYAVKSTVLEWEQRQFWKSACQFEAVDIYNAPIDTTFALYLEGARWTYNAARVGEPYTVDHLPWHVDSERLNAEEIYYQEHMVKGLGWHTWGANACHSVTVNNRCNKKTSKDSPKNQPNVEMHHYSKLPAAVDMAPYASWYGGHLRQIATIRNGNQITVVEAGVRYGCSARIFREALDEYSNWRLVLIDPVPTKEALEVTKDDRVTFLRENAEIAATMFDDESIDLLHIDADTDATHPYDLAFSILTAFSPKLKTDASVIFHDCTDHFPGIKRLVGELATAGWIVEYCEPIFGGSQFTPIAAPAIAKRNGKQVSVVPLDISVVIPVIQNRFLGQLLENIRKNTVRPAEIIVIDNSCGLATNTCQCAKDLPIRYLRQNENIGVNASWNLGLKTAKSELVSILNDDLVLPEGFFKSIQETFRTFPQTGFVVPSTVGPGVPGSNRAPWQIGTPEDVRSSEGTPEVVSLESRDGGWAMTVRKSLVSPIPQSMFTFCGDDYIFGEIKRQGFGALKLLNCSVYHYVGISFDLSRRKRLHLPDIIKDQRAWRTIQAENKRSQR